MNVQEDVVFESEQYFGKINPVLKDELDKKPRIYRLTTPKGRIYFTKQSVDSPSIIFNSGTTIIDNFRDKEGEEAIHKWKVGLINQGINPGDAVKERQDYGTLMHLAYGKILQGEKTSFDKLKDFLIDFHEEIRMPKEYVANLVQRNLQEFKKDVASLLLWITEYKVEPLGIEVMVKSDKYQVATSLDLIAYITFKEKGFWGEEYKTGINAGNPKESFKEVRQLVIIDFKSGKKGFYPKNVLQLLLSKKIFEENFSLKVEGIYNFAPNSWKGNTATYKFYNQERENKQITFLKAIQENVLERGMMEFEYVIKKKSKLELKGEIDITNIIDPISYQDLQRQADQSFVERNTIHRDSFKDVIAREKISTEPKLRKYCNTLSEEELKNMATTFGIAFFTSEEFINEISILFKNGNKKN